MPHTKRTSSLVALLALFSLSAEWSAAHGGLHEQIESVTAEIVQHPDNARLYLKRGELHRLHKDWKAGLADFDRAARLDPALIGIDFSRGRLLYDAGRNEAARDVLNRFLEHHDREAKAWLTLARVQLRLGQPAAAVRDFTLAIRFTPDPKPEHYLERARAQARLGDSDVDAALGGLDAGMARLGPLITLQMPAIELCLQGKRYREAMRRLDTIIERAHRKERWLAYRGDILLMADKPSEARKAWLAARTAIERLPVRFQHTQLVGDIDKHVRGAIAKLATPESAPLPIRAPLQKESGK